MRASDRFHRRCIAAPGGRAGLERLEERLLLSNSAPVLAASGPLTLSPILEDETNSPGTLISVLLASRDDQPVTDADPGALQGIAVTSIDSTNGQWEFSTDGGATWNALAAAADSQAMLLADTDIMRFVPDANFNGAADFTFRAWDQTSGTHGQTADASVTGGATAFSDGTATGFIPVAPVNDAPVLDISGTMTLAPISANAAGNTGTLITDLIASAGGNRITDVDAGAVEGIAVVATDNAHGAWQYSLDGGGHWSTFKGYYTSARLLAADVNTRIRFVPQAGFSGTLDPAIAFRAWDQTEGTNGGVLNAMNKGGTTSISTGTETASLGVDLPNHAPVLDNSGVMQLKPIPPGYVSNGGTLTSDILASAGGNRITDADSGAREGIAVVATANDNGSWQYSIDAGASWTTFKGYYTSARLLAADADTRVRFVPNAGFSGVVDPAITFRAWDQTEGSNGGVINATIKGGTTSISLQTETASLGVNAVNHAPVLDTSVQMKLTSLPPSGNGNNIGTLISWMLASAGGAPISDADADAVEGIAVVATNNVSGRWQYSTNNGTTWTDFKGYYTGARLLASDASTRIRFLPSPSFVGELAPAITFRAWDQTAGLNGGTLDVIHSGSTSISLQTGTATIDVGV